MNDVESAIPATVDYGMRVTFGVAAMLIVAALVILHRAAVEMVAKTMDVSGLPR